MTKFLFITICTSLLLTSTLGMVSCEILEEEDLHVENADPKDIVGGTETNYSNWKGVLALSSDSMGTFCTGTLIDTEVVLSAAHCIYLPDQGHDLRGSTGSINLIGGSNTNFPDSTIHYTSASQVVIHPNWDGNEGMDVSLIKLANPITEVEFYQIREAPDAVMGDKGKIVGYGATSLYDLASAGIHREGDVTILTVTEDEMEIGNPSGTCVGDSGGPLFTSQGDKWVLSGTTAYGTADACVTTGGAWDMRIVPYRNWIEDTVMSMTGHGLLGSSGGGDADSDTDSDADGDSDGDADGDAGDDADSDADKVADNPESIFEGDPSSEDCGCYQAGASTLTRGLLSLLSSF